RGARTMDEAQHLSPQLDGMKRLLDADTGAILFRHPTLLCIDIRNPAGLAKLLAERFKAQLPVAV
ncbi:MAG: hypothetical protein ACRC1L_05350, partial [Prochlorococcaceae cyanobacterium]